MRDTSVAGSRRLEIALPDGARIEVMEVPGGWAGGGVAHPSLGGAVEAACGRRRDQEEWIAVLEEFATPLGSAPGAPLPAAQATRLSALPRRCPGAYVDGPRAHDTGGWYVFVGGLPGGAWVMEHGDTPLDAARGALARAEALLT